MDIKEIRSAVKQYGVIALHGKTEPELTKIACLLADELDKTETKFLAATSTYSETGAKTEWEIWDKSGSMRPVWIVKKVTRFSDTASPLIEKEHVMLVDRAIADQFVALLNTQQNPLF